MTASNDTPADEKKSVLSADETSIIAKLKSARSDGPTDMLVITDAGRDHDDELALTVLRGLERLGLAKLKAAVVNLSTDDQRARLVKGAVSSLGFAEDVPVAIGSNDNPGYKPKKYEFDASYIADGNAVEADGQALMKKTFEEAKAAGKKLTLVIIAGMTDAWEFVQQNPDLVRDTVSKVHIMGGVQTKGNELVLDGKGFFLPDSGYNNTVDKHLNSDPKTDPVGPSAKGLYERLQELGIPTEIVTRNTAYAAAVSPQFYADLAESGHPVAKRLERDQKAAIENLWENVQKGTLGPRLTPEWFLQTFSSNPAEAKEHLAAEPHNPWKVVDKLNLYDAISVIAAAEPNNSPLFTPDMVGNHRIIGTSPEKPGIPDPAEMRALLSGLAKIGLGADLPAVRLAPTFNAQSIPELDAPDRKAVKDARLVMIFDKGTSADDVAKAVVDAFEKTDIHRFDIVSHDPKASGGAAYQKTSVIPPFWSMDAWADAEGGVKAPQDAYKDEFRAEAAKAWEELQKPATVAAKFSGTFAVTAGMSPDELKKAAAAAIDAAYEAAAKDGQNALKREQAKRSFDGAYDVPLAHKGIVAALGSEVRAFAYINAENWDETQARLLKTAKALHLPVGADFNAMALVSLPGDDAQALKERNEKTRDAVVSSRVNKRPAAG
jgi:hypothetical protein